MKLHSELDDTPLLDKENITEYQRLIGILQLMQVSIRLDISLAVSSLARFQCNLREEHASAVLKIFRYLKKYPKHGIIIDADELNHIGDTTKLKPDFGNQYCEFEEEIDPEFPEALMDEIQMTIFADSNYDYDKVTGKLITGLIRLLGSTLIN